MYWSSLIGSLLSQHYPIATQRGFSVTFTSVHLDHSKAKKKLESALLKAKALDKPQSKYKDQVAQVISGSHLTYRYILITNLLAKATDSSVNPLALQVGADFDAAFDSRSLCHKVFVPFERDFLDGKLGRSNEPYLNKPARHKALSSENAVRKGYDRLILETCILVLSRCSQQEADDALVDAIFLTLKRPSINDNTVNRSGNTSVHEILNRFSGSMLHASNEGENCALLTGLAFNFLSLSMSGTFDIRVHPVNQSGASSKEVLDIDVYSKNELRFTAEVKDKEYFREDVDHAANKVRLAGHDAMFFIEGPNALSALTPTEFDEIGREHGVRITVAPVKTFFMLALGLCQNDLEPASAWGMIAKISQSARFKQVTNNQIQDVAKEVGLLEA